MCKVLYYISLLYISIYIIVYIIVYIYIVYFSLLILFFSKIIFLLSKLVNLVYFSIKVKPTLALMPVNQVNLVYFWFTLKNNH
jgi:hypothetical protein